MELGFQALGQDSEYVDQGWTEGTTHPFWMGSRVPAANERTVNVGMTTRNQQSEINEVDQQNCFQNV